MSVRPAAVLLATLATAAAAAASGPIPLAVSEPAVFAPGVISGPAHDAAPAFARDGRTVWFV